MRDVSSWCGGDQLICAASLKSEEMVSSTLVITGLERVGTGLTLEVQYTHRRNAIQQKRNERVNLATPAPHETPRESDKLRDGLLQLYPGAPFFF